MPTIEKGLSGSERSARIEATKGVCGGSPRIAGTRIPLWSLAAARDAGRSEKAIVEMYPSLKGRNLAAAWEYIDAHRKQIDREIRSQAE